MRAPEGHTFTARSALWAAEQVAAGRVPSGLYPPTTVLGPEVALALKGVGRIDPPEAST